MLSVLKQDLAFMGQGSMSFADMTMESSSNDFIRDAFLDDMELKFLGVEDDPTIEKQIADIPEFDEMDLTEKEKKELVNLAESFIPDIDELI